MIKFDKTDKDIEIIMKDQSGIGYGYVYDNGEGYLGTVYQNRLNDKLLKKTADYTDITEDIANTSKSYIIEGKSLEEIINGILDFYFINKIEKPIAVKKEINFQTAIKHLEDNKLKYYIFHV